VPRYVAFYTEGTLYEEEVKHLVSDCERLGLELITRGYEDTGSWVRNAGIKPQFILEMLTISKQDIVYVDADARIRRLPMLFKNFRGDLGVHYLNGKELLSGTIYLANTPDVRLLVKLWAQRQAERPDTWDQKTLQAVVSETGFKVTPIPPAYVQIFDSMKHHGPPVIEHMQASRRVRKKKIVKRSNIPNVLGRVRVREAPDGTLYITRRDKVAESFLDKHATRIKNQLRWYPIFDEKLQINYLKPEFNGSKCYIVGKGPSLDHLRQEHFPERWPIICLNEAVHQVEKLGLSNSIYGLQQDAKLKKKCLPKRGRLFVSVKAANFYAGEKDVYIFDSRHYKLSMNSLSVSAAIAITKSLGATGYELLCFDACVNKKLEYAKCIGYDASWGGHKKRFLTHRPKIIARAGGLPTKFTIPEAPASASSGTPQQSPRNPKERRDPARKGRSISLQANSSWSLKTGASPRASQPDRSDSPPQP